LPFLVPGFILENIETLHGFSFSFQSSKRNHGMERWKLEEMKVVIVKEQRTHGKITRIRVSDYTWVSSLIYRFKSN
jgi:hypothetical protein